MAKQQVSLREANQHLSRYVAQVEKGGEVLITRRGKPVALLTGIPERKRISREQRAALTRLKASARALKIGRVRREDLYDRASASVAKVSIDTNLLVYAIDC